MSNPAKAILDADFLRILPGIRSFLVLCFFCLSAPMLMAQQSPYITGRLIDWETGEPVVFATLRLKGFALGVISDRDGGFRIPQEFKDKKADLEISCMGYQNRIIPFEDLKPRGNLIQLRPATFELFESVVTGKRKEKLAANQIVQYALNNIRTNYPDQQYSLLGYYRDYQLREGDYVNLNEALIEVLDQGFQSIDTQLTDFLMYEYKKNTSFAIDSFAAKEYDYQEWDKTAVQAEVPSYGGNELMLLRVHDPIRNHRINTFSFINRIRQDFIPAHFFNLQGVKTYDNRKVYEISVSRYTVNYRVIGTLYIDVENYGIRRMDYRVQKKASSRYSRGRSGMKKGQGNSLNAIDDGDLIFGISVEYKEQEGRSGGKLYLNYISFQNAFRLIRPAPFRIKETEVNWTYKVIVLRLNHSPASPDKLNKYSFKVEYQDKKVPIKEIKYLPEEKMVMLKVDMMKNRQKHLRMLFSREYDKEKKTLKIQNRKVKDSLGNLLEDRPVEFLDQYREFFTQQILPLRSGVQPALKMNRELPLFDSRQPLFVRDSTAQYWMNTPLIKEDTN